MAGPSEGMFSSPIAFGRYRARRSGPRNTYFMANQNITASPPAVRLPGRGLDTVVLDYTGSSDLENVQADGGFRRARVVLPGSPRPVGRRGDGVPAVPAGPAVPNPLPTVSPIRSPRSGPRPAVVHGCEPFRSEGGPVGVWLQHGFTGCPASMRPFGMWLAERGLPDLRQPLLLFSSDEDHTSKPANSRLIMAKAGSPSKELIRLTNSYHVATMDYDAESIFERVLAFAHSLAAGERTHST